MALQSNLTLKTTIKDGGRIVIPARIREAIGADVGDSVTLTVENHELRISTPKEALKRLQALVRKHVPEGVSLVDELIKDRREEAANE